MAGRRPAGAGAAERRLAARQAPRVQLRIELRGVKPPVWRRLQVPETVTLGRLHDILQCALGWTDSHLHEWQVGPRRYGLPDPDWPEAEPVADERRVRLQALLAARVRRFSYVYDFGDHWEHVIRVEDRLAPDPAQPPLVCLGGANACPPEDVGGVWGYANFLKILADPGHEEHADLVDWAGGAFDPTVFNLTATNELLETIRL